MTILLFALQAALVAFSVVSAEKCLSLDCGSTSGWFIKPRESWTLESGPYSTEVVPSSACLVGGIRGFKAKVCLDTEYPDLECAGDDKIFVDKNGARVGHIDVIPYCGILPI